MNARDDGGGGLTARAHLRDDRDRVVLPRREGVRAARWSMARRERRGFVALGTPRPRAWTKLKCRAKVRRGSHTPRGSFSFGAVLFGHVNRMFSYGFGSKR